VSAVRSKEPLRRAGSGRHRAGPCNKVTRPHESSHVAGACGKPAPGGVARLGEQAADQLVRHVQDRIRQLGFEVEDRGCQVVGQFDDE